MNVMNEKQPNGERIDIRDVFIIYSKMDTIFASELFNVLESQGISACLASDADNAHHLQSNILKTIRSAKVFVPLITDNFAMSPQCVNDLYIAFNEATNRAKTILPVCFSAYAIQNPIIQLCVSSYQFISANSCSRDTVLTIAGNISTMINGQKAENIFYSRLSEYIRSGSNSHAVSLICDYIPELCEKLYNTQEPTERKQFISEILSLTEKINELYDSVSDDNAKNVAEKKNTILAKISELLVIDEFRTENLYYLSLALRFIYFERELKRQVIEITAGKDLANNIPTADYAAKQAPFLEKYNYQCIMQSITADYLGIYTEDEHKTILETPNFVFALSAQRNVDNFKDNSVTKNEIEPSHDISKDDELLSSIASFVKEGNRLFDIIGSRHISDEFLRCLILSYERLKNFCEIVGEKDICAECIDKIIDLKEKLNNDNLQNDTFQKAHDGIKSLLGLTISKSGKFDVYICHKNEDADIAQDLYFFMKRNMKEAFYDKESLPQMSESEYRDSIMQALDSASHFVVIFSDLSYLESYWVKLEMKIFQSEIDEGRKRNSNFLMIVTNEVYDQIMASNKAVLPIDFRRCEIMRVEEYKTKLLSYFNK